MKDITKIMKVTGFFIVSNGDPSVGISEASWKIVGDIYFDDQEELEKYRKEIKEFFENYVGDISYVQTFEEYQKELDVEDFMLYAEHPVRYLIQDKEDNDYQQGGNNTFKQANFCASYSSDIGKAIHFGLPDYMSMDDYSRRIIPSTDPKFREILLDEADVLRNRIGNLKNELERYENSLRLIRRELKLGQKK